jgi:ATPase subunit of ABC transporter with duplicated ATPase domains
MNTSAVQRHDYQARHETYDGALLLVTHDRRMLQNVLLDRSWLVDNGCVAEL